MSEAKIKMIEKSKKYYKEKLNRIADVHVSQIQTVQEIIINYLKLQLISIFNNNYTEKAFKSR